MHVLKLKSEFFEGQQYHCKRLEGHETINDLPYYNFELHVQIRIFKDKSKRFRFTGMDRMPSYLQNRT